MAEVKLYTTLPTMILSPLATTMPAEVYWTVTPVALNSTESPREAASVPFDNSNATCPEVARSPNLAPVSRT